MRDLPSYQKVSHEKRKFPTKDTKRTKTGRQQSGKTILEERLEQRTYQRRSPARFIKRFVDFVGTPFRGRILLVTPQGSIFTAQDELDMDLFVQLDVCPVCSR